VVPSETGKLVELVRRPEAAYHSQRVEVLRRHMHMDDFLEVEELQRKQVVHDRIDASDRVIMEDRRWFGNGKSRQGALERGQGALTLFLLARFVCLHIRRTGRMQLIGLKVKRDAG
jgi:hypothetical protein